VIFCVCNNLVKPVWKVFSDKPGKKFFVVENIFCCSLVFGRPDMQMIVELPRETDQLKQ
jgi:hypothetical protein